MTARYLLTFSYLGTAFRGSQKQPFRDGIIRESVQEVLESAFENYSPFVGATCQFAGRTDSGVHALGATAHVDLPPLRTKFMHPDHLTINLNKYFNRHDKAIHIINTRRVNSEFNARFSAKARTYLYRLAFIKPDVLKGSDARVLPFPIEELKRSHLIRTDDFDVAKARDAIKLFEGYHDFESFKKQVKKYINWSHSRRNIYSAEIKRGTPLVTPFSEAAANNFEFLDLVFRGSGFVYNQVRRMVGTIIACAVGKITCDDIVLMLRVPSKNGWSPRAEKAPAYGLYLCKVEYDEKDLIFEEANNNIE